MLVCGASLLFLAAVARFDGTLTPTWNECVKAIRHRMRYSSNTVLPCTYHRLDSLLSPWADSVLCVLSLFSEITCCKVSN